jgi:hypothetical protein
MSYERSDINEGWSIPMPEYLDKEQVYSQQKLSDPITNGFAVLYYKWENFKTSWDIHVPKQNNPLFDYIMKTSMDVVTIISFLTETQEKYGMQGFVKEDEPFLHITQYSSFQSLDDELIYKEVKGEWLKNNLQILKLNNRRTCDFPTN